MTSSLSSPYLTGKNGAVCTGQEFPTPCLVLRLYTLLTIGLRASLKPLSLCLESDVSFICLGVTNMVEGRKPGTRDRMF